jgi:hypothetical protein
MKSEPTPLPIQIPPRYAGILGVDPSYIWRVNMGKRHFSVHLSRVLMEWAKEDPDLAGLSFHHLRPDLAEVCGECPHVK